MIELIKPSHEILHITKNVLQLIEGAGRTCYKSEANITDESASKFVKMVTNRGHHSVIEHGTMTVRFICDRGVTHEIVRHRLAAYSQESTRYVNYERRGIQFIIPPWLDIEPGQYDYESLHTDIDNGTPLGIWAQSMIDSTDNYNNLINNGWRPEQARSVLPNSLKTEIIMTANVREWRHVFNLRCSKACHPQMREIMLPLMRDAALRIPIIFDDIRDKYEGDYIK